ncbi:MAG: hypothetical protein ACI8PQ_001875, partial [Planctomycetota bacterium]
GKLGDDRHRLALPLFKHTVQYLPGDTDLSDLHVQVPCMHPENVPLRELAALD